MFLESIDSFPAILSVKICCFDILLVKGHNPGSKQALICILHPINPLLHLQISEQQNHGLLEVVHPQHPAPPVHALYLQRIPSEMILESILVEHYLWFIQFEFFI